jgi:hypothetical protein
MKLAKRIKKWFRGTSVCECAWRTTPGLKQLEYNAELQLFSIELRSEVPGGGVFHMGFLYCPECGKRIAPLQPAELMMRDEEVPEPERLRLANLAAALKTYDQVFANLGRPDCEIRSVRYDKLSTSASLTFFSGTDEKVDFFITPNWNLARKGQQAPPNGCPGAPPRTGAPEGPTSVS